MVSKIYWFLFMVCHPKWSPQSYQDWNGVLIPKPFEECDKHDAKKA